MQAALVKALAVATTIAALAAAWFFVGPTQLGGRTSYAVTFGISMVPHFHKGDLVVLRRQSTYRVGDVVAYRSHDLHRNVLHRIIAIHGGRYTFKGDNNGFIDPERPTDVDLVGSEWFKLRGAGNWVASLHSPRNAAVVAFVLVLFLLLGGGGTVAVRRQRRSGQVAAPLPRPRPPEPRSGTGAAASAGFVVAAAGAGALCAAVIL